jgi:hypothetical protein
VHVPPPVPQHGWPAPPHVPHLFPAVLVTQASGAVHAIAPPPEQHAWSAAPHGPHVPAAPPARPPQPRPVVQVPPPVPQQGWPLAPHAAQVFPPAPRTQPRPIPHAMPPVQQRWPAAPHGVHVPPIPIIAPSQPRPAWQFEPGQHACPAAPQVVVQVPSMAFPGGSEQARPARQAVASPPPQQAWPSPPQDEQRSGIIGPGAAQVKPVWQAAPVAQQAWLAPPQVPQVSAAPMSPCAQPSPAAHELVAPPWQHACPEAPHATQPPAVHRRDAPEQNVPPPPTPQHGWFTPPHGVPAAVAHDPAMHVPDMAPHGWLAPTQMRPVSMRTQQPPPLQVLVAQQGWPGIPHAAPPGPPSPVPPPGVAAPSAGFMLVLLLHEPRATARHITAIHR